MTHRTTAFGTGLIQALKEILEWKRGETVLVMVDRKPHMSGAAVSDPYADAKNDAGSRPTHPATGRRTMPSRSSEISAKLHRMRSKSAAGENDV